jgi:hypothetical protein
MAVETFDIGDCVQCDLCGKDYTTSDDVGGFMFASKGVCPTCAPRLEADAKRYDEERYIGERAWPGETFKAFILRMRGGDNTVTITTGDDFTKLFEV